MQSAWVIEAFLARRHTERHRLISDSEFAVGCLWGATADDVVGAFPMDLPEIQTHLPLFWDVWSSVL